MKSKRAQSTMSLPFNWLFALFLIIVFIFVAIYGIKYFMDMGKCTSIGTAYETLQDAVSQAQKSSSSDRGVELTLPGIKYICFSDLSMPITGILDVYDEISIYEGNDVNTFLFPPENSCNMPFKKIKYLDLNKTIANKNPYCVEVIDDKVQLRLQKEFYDRAVTIK